MRRGATAEDGEAPTGGRKAYRSERVVAAERRGAAAEDWEAPTGGRVTHGSVGLATGPAAKYEQGSPARDARQARTAAEATVPRTPVRRESRRAHARAMRAEQPRTPPRRPVLAAESRAVAAEASAGHGTPGVPRERDSRAIGTAAPREATVSMRRAAATFAEPPPPPSDGPEGVRAQQGSALAPWTGMRWAMGQSPWLGQSFSEGELDLDSDEAAFHLATTARPRATTASGAAFWRWAATHEHTPFPRVAQQLATGGLRVRFCETMPRATEAPAHLVAWAPPGSLLQESLDELLQLGLLEPLPRDAGTGSYVSAFALRKANGKGRLIVNCSTINQHAGEPPHFRLPRLGDVLAAAPDAQAGAFADVSMGFFRVDLHPTSRDHFRLAVRAAPGAAPTQYRLTGLPMGYSWSPYLFQMVTSNVAALAPRPTPCGMTACCYLDDYLVLSALPSDTAAARAWLRAIWYTLLAAGLPVSPKSSRQLSVTPKLLGFDADLRTRRIAVPTSKLQSALETVSRALGAKTLSLRHRAHVLGRLDSLGPGYLFARLDTSGLVSTLAAMLRTELPEEEEDSDLSLERFFDAPVRGSYNAACPLLPSERADLVCWRVRLEALLASEGARWSPSAAVSYLPWSLSAETIVLASDSTRTGWGFHLVMREEHAPPPLGAPGASTWRHLRERVRPEATSRGVRSPRELDAACEGAGLWAPQSAQTLHITALETAAAVAAVLHLATVVSLHRASVVVLSDCSATVACLNRRGSRRPALATAYAPLVELMSSTGCSVRAAHLPGVANTRADALSRRFDESSEARALPPTSTPLTPRTSAQEEEGAEDEEVLPSSYPLAEAELTAAAFTAVSRCTPVPISTDLFANSRNAKTASFVSWSGSNGALAANAAVADWPALVPEGTAALCFPPPKLLPQVAARLATGCIAAVLVAPFFPKQMWCDLASRTASHVWELPRGSVTGALGARLLFPQRFLCFIYSKKAPTSLSTPRR